jgi:ABC-type transport system involved in multi-copper enzyme maturation permease subunit
MKFMMLVQKECDEDIFSLRGAALYLVGCGILSVFSLLLVSDTELSLLDNAQAVYMMAGIVMALAILVAIIRGSDGFAGERERQTLETLMITPVNAVDVGMAKLAGTYFSWLIFFALSVPYLWAVGSTGQNLWPAYGFLFFTGSFLVLIFGGFIMGLSARIRTFKGVLSVGLILFLVSGSPVLLGPSLRQTGIGRFIDVINPFGVALNMLDSVVVDSQGIGFQVSHLTILVLYSLASIWFLRQMTRRVEL